MAQSVLSPVPGPAAVIASCRTLASAARTERHAQQQSVLTSIKPSLLEQQRLLVEVAGDGGRSTWLGTPPTVLTPSSIFNKNDFRDAHSRPSLLWRSQKLSQLADHERQKKRQHAERINRVDHGSFTPLCSPRMACAAQRPLFSCALWIHELMTVTVTYRIPWLCGNCARG